ncbi:hypothetical protein [Candidatus Palauibacter polyketidifaciens]|uniref:hypothetical protein n=1 Tax=Candidatus Palauibacter polyketidifaciens TaxID=3056740 RepID=UPI00139B209C|nr:hypothetical protein [Candidatus Palauibacter polyketidifaciens]MDE2719476.1 hypothetical protein [Candidatus Palauibacter polyketidifaciens]MYE34806.1 hypothetical protein [Gemmatimonadales bacterium]
MDAKVTKELPHAGNGIMDDPGSRAARLGDLGRRIPPPRIADVWLFPPLPQVEESSEFFLFTRILEDGGRALYSARMVPANGTPAHQVVVEHGRAPANRVPGLVAGLQRRLGQPAAVRHVPIEGDGKRWEALLEQSREAGASVDPAGRGR